MNGGLSENKDIYIKMMEKINLIIKGDIFKYNQLNLMNKRNLLVLKNNFEKYTKKNNIYIIIIQQK